MCLNPKDSEAYLVHTERVPTLYSGNRGRCQGDGAVSPTLTRGRASASDVHAVVIEES